MASKTIDNERHVRYPGGMGRYVDVTFFEGARTDPGGDSIDKISVSGNDCDVVKILAHEIAINLGIPYPKGKTQMVEDCCGVEEYISFIEGNSDKCKQLFYTKLDSEIYDRFMHTIEELDRGRLPEERVNGEVDMRGQYIPKQD